jgi:hypothetical protein
MANRIQMVNYHDRIEIAFSDLGAGLCSGACRSRSGKRLLAQNAQQQKAQASPYKAEETTTRESLACETLSRVR